MALEARQMDEKLEKTSISNASVEQIENANFDLQEVIDKQKLLCGKFSKKQNSEYDAKTYMPLIYLFDTKCRPDK